MNRIESLRALLSDAQKLYYRFWVRYNTAKSCVFSSENDLDGYYRILEGIMYYRSWINVYSRDLQAAMRCK